MKKVLLVIVLFLISQNSFSQNKWELIENELREQLLSKMITSEERYLKEKTVAGHLSESLTAWYKKESKIESPKNKGTYLIFKKNRLKIEK